jgi:hypothetical protein
MSLGVDDDAYPQAQQVVDLADHESRFRTSRSSVPS